MADDLSSAPQTGGSEPASAPSTSSGPSTAPAASEGKSSAPAKADKSPSISDAIRSAFNTVEARPPTETERAAAVLRDGPGADEKLVANAKSAAEKQARDATARSEASERTAKGWETRRANMEAAKAAPPVADAATVATPPATPTPTAPSRYQPPQRMSAEAKSTWDAAPEPLRAEVVRMHDELSAGLVKHREGAERWNELAEYDRLSQETYRAPLKETLKNYVEFDRLLATNMPAGIERLVKNQGYESLYQFAKQIVDEVEPDTAFDTENTDLQRRLEETERRLAAYETAQQRRQQEEMEQRSSSIQNQVAEFSKAHPRFDELARDIETELHNPRFAPDLEPMARLQKAYEKVERLNPAPSLSPPAPDIPAPDLVAQTRRGQASITGAPGSGSNPAVRRPVPSSARDAITAAFSKLGIA
jgi:hypothetical protein